jgi:hypothetical protein
MLSSHYPSLHESLADSTMVSKFAVKHKAPVQIQTKRSLVALLIDS